VNGLGEAVKPPRGASHPGLSLASSKSCYGHTEGAAGLTGTLLSMESARRRAAAPLLSCRTLNPYVASALGDWRRWRITSAVPRASGPLPGLHAHATLCGTSSFGMGGTNAHALVSAARSSELQWTPAVPWQQVRWAIAAGTALPRLPSSVSCTIMACHPSCRLWPAPPASHILGSAISIPGQHSAVFTAFMLRPAVGYLWDHAVNNVAVLPAAALFEMATAAWHMLASTEPEGVFARPAVATNCRIPAAAELHDSADNFMVLTTDVSLDSGNLAIEGGCAVLDSATGRRSTHLAVRFRKSIMLGGGAGQGEVSRLAVSSGVPGSTWLSHLTRGSSFLEAWQTGNIAVSLSDSCGYYCHPALLDSCLHLGASIQGVLAAEQQPVAVSIPVAAEAYVGGDAPPGMLRGLGRLTGAPSSRSVHSSYTLGSPGSKSCVELSRLESRPTRLVETGRTRQAAFIAPTLVSSQRHPPARPMLYTVQWQAHSAALMQGSWLSCMGDSASLSLRHGQGGVDGAVEVYSQPPPLATAALVAASQCLPAGPNRDSPADVATRGSGAIQPQVCPPFATSMVAAVAWAVVRVAASEQAGSRCWRLVDLSSSACQPAMSAAEAVDTSGSVVQGGMLLRPALLPAASGDFAAGASAAWKSLPGGRVVISGGMGGGRNLNCIYIDFKPHPYLGGSNGTAAGAVYDRPWPTAARRYWIVGGTLAF
jgi:hypothetical protein